MFHHSRRKHATEREDGPDAHATAVCVSEALIWVAKGALRGHEADQHDHQLQKGQATTHHQPNASTRETDAFKEVSVVLETC